MNESMMHRPGVRPRVANGQVWQSNDNRVGRLRAVRIVSANHFGNVLVENVVSKRITTIARDQFCVGQRGWSLLKEAPSV